MQLVNTYDYMVQTNSWLEILPEKLFYETKEPEEFFLTNFRNIFPKLLLFFAKFSQNWLKNEEKNRPELDPNQISLNLGPEKDIKTQNQTQGQKMNLTHP